MISLDWTDYLTAFEHGGVGKILGGNNHYLTIFQVLIIQSHPTNRGHKSYYHSSSANSHKVH